jgi:pyruvate dehydrogenase complex dehydrogenase (E1) component
VLSQLVRRGEAKPEVLEQAIRKYRLDLTVSEALAAG